MLAKEKHPAPSSLIYTSDYILFTEQGRTSWSRDVTVSDCQSSANCPLIGLPAIVAAHPPDTNVDNWLTVEGGMV